MNVIYDNELVEAATEGDDALVRERLDGGAAPDARNEKGQSALAMAAARGHTDVVQLLLDFGADPNGAGSDPSPARAACTTASGECLRLLLAAGADPNACFTDGQSLLVGTILAEGTVRDSERRVDYLALAGLLVDAGARIDEADSEGATALTRAVVLDRPEAVRWLLARGADPKLGGHMGLSLIDIAEAKKLREIAQLLLAAGARS